MNSKELILYVDTAILQFSLLMCCSVWLARLPLFKRGDKRDSKQCSNSGNYKTNLSFNTVDMAYIRINIIMLLQSTRIEILLY